MEQDQITITISGRPGIGKSACLQNIASLLDDIGASVVLKGQIDLRPDEKLNVATRCLVGAKISIVEDHS